VLPSVARRTDSGGGVLGERQLALSPLVRVFREPCKLSQRVHGRSSGTSTIFLFAYIEVCRQLILLRY